MRVIECSDSFYPIVDGVGSVVFQYALNLGRKGHEVYVVAPQTDTGWRGGWPFEMVDYVGIPLRMMKSYTAGAPILDNHFLKRMGMIEADLVHVHSPFMAGQAGLAYAKKRGVPLVGTFHSKYYDDFLQLTGLELLAEAGTKFVVDFYNKCSEVWAVSAASAETLRSYGYKGEIRVVPNGTDIAPLVPGAVASVGETFGLADGIPALLFVGQLNWKKNLRCVLEAVAHLEGDFRLVLAGQGPHEKELRELGDKLGLGEKLVFTGHLTDRDTLNALFSRSELFLFPSVYDNAPMVLREAAAMGTPAVVVRGSNAAEGIRHGENGYLCEDDPEDLARVIREALADPEALYRVGAAAKATIPIPWSRIIDEVIGYYKDLIA